MDGPMRTQNTRNSFVLAAAALCACNIGCATALNVASEDSRQVYGGVQIDGALVGHDVGILIAGEDSKIADEIPFGIGLVAIGDMPFSVIADTLTLPITVPAAILRLIAEGNKESGAEHSTEGR